MDQDRQDAPSLEDAETLGEALRAARLASGRSMAQLSTMTRVHPRYLTALEQNEFSVLPSRIFSMGYVRAYAGALGLDELTAVERFKREFPEAAVPLQAPTGAALQQMRRTSPKILAALGVLIVAVVGWNVFQRVVRIEPPHPSDLVAVPRNWAEEADAEVERALYLGAPRAAPPDQTTPALYITPGLEAQLTGIDPDDPNAAVVLPAPPVQAAFNPRGAVYGASATTSQVILQAKKPAALVVRQGDGRILFARQLAAGEAWRAPPGLSATVDVSDPAAFDVYLNGEHSGALPAAQSPLGTLNARAQTEARQSEARAAAAAEAQARARAAQAAAAQAAAPAAASPPAVAPAG
ncbi:helix-turn-helix domain-containing protein [Brevundimonas sp.]|uniref:helix-turn-helix domain-containing protein n=1 Tax=Brevundimonas sp. TaxID=1871086 RepID=UPI0028AEC540|nr:helix-turn-helix domain-containing protein [Brevundimonas sp.]